MKIGITLGMKSEGEGLWINGIKLNALMLAQLLKNSKENHEVFFINTTKIKINDKLPWDLEEFPTYYYLDKIFECDVVFTLGGQVHQKHLKKVQENGGKIISYRCGNNYIVHLETSIFGEDPEPVKITKHVEDCFDQIWYVPQQHETNRGYLECLYRTPVKAVPFVYSPRWIDTQIDKIEKNYKDKVYKNPARYQPSSEKKKLAIMEPNLNVVKYSMIPTMIAEMSYRGTVGKEKIDYLSVTNGGRLSRKSEYLGTINALDLKKDGKIFLESRYNSPYFLSQYSDILLCHQILNPLNYLYLDAAYMGYPVLHNAWMCKDLGYFYNDCDVIEGAEKLDWILENHDKNIEEYNKKTDEVLWRYSVENPELVKVYDRLLKDVMENKMKKEEYDPMTNNYE